MKAKTFPGFEALKLNMVDKLELSFDYMDHLSMSNNIWICYKKKKSNSFLSSFLMENFTSTLINIVGKFNNQYIIDKNNIKLM
jgi:hypothetical protein